tara:strand:- start:220 stop:408 length:189 start_codon:yes stop_codon:yes gene_type:complete
MKVIQSVSGISKELQLPISQQVTTIASNSQYIFDLYTLKAIIQLPIIITLHMQIIPRLRERG